MYISYCRKSRLQDPEELARQEQLVVEYCDNKGYKLEYLNKRISLLILVGHLIQEP